MNITGVCVTYNRPQFLGRAIHCFLQQDHPGARLLVLDDAGQYPCVGGDGTWKMVSRASRYKTLGEKRNDAFRLACQLFPETEGIAVWDDDDVYWPHAMAAVSAALEKGAWAQPSVVYEPSKRGSTIVQLKRQYTGAKNGEFVAYGGSWAWRRSTLETLSGYPHIDNCEDQFLAGRARQNFGRSTDTICAAYPEPYYLYHRREIGSHMSDVPDPYAHRQCDCITKVEEIPIGWNGPNVYELSVESGIHPRPW